jgi:hypothetical protein
MESSGALIVRTASHGGGRENFVTKHKLRRLARVLVTLTALAVPLAQAASPALANASHPVAAARQARPANVGTFWIQDYNGAYQGSEVFMPGHNQIAYIANPPATVFQKVTISGQWYELEGAGECLDASNVSGAVQVYEESCAGTTAEQWTNTSGRNIENRHFGGTGPDGYLCDVCAFVSGNLGLGPANSQTEWKYPDAA